jgi:hypothetical protein
MWTLFRPVVLLLSLSLSVAPQVGYVASGEHSQPQEAGARATQERERGRKWEFCDTWECESLRRAHDFQCRRLTWQRPGETVSEVIALYSRGYVEGDCFILRPVGNAPEVWLHYLIAMPCKYVDDWPAPCLDVPLRYVSNEERQVWP